MLAAALCSTVRHLLRVGLLAALAACATFDPPKPWEKGELAKPEMQFSADRLEARMNQHVYTSKEGASGGDAIGGGGCGCN